MFKNISNKTKLLISLVVVLIILVVAMPNSSEDYAAPQVTPTPQPSTVVKTVAPVSAKTSAENYTKLIKQYEGYRIQFDAACQAIPKNVTYKNGTKILLDNRSGDARYISLGGVSYYLAGYGYKVVTLSSSVLPKTLFFNCGAGVNVGQILIQN